MKIIKPLGDRVVVELIEGEEKLDSGIVIPDVSRDKLKQGKVIANGTANRDIAGNVIQFSANVGDTVTWEYRPNTSIKEGNKTIFILRDSDLLAIVE